MLGFDGDLRVDNVTTVDPTELDQIRGLASVSKSVVEWVNKTYSTVSVGLFMDVETARKMFATDDKKSVLKKALTAGKLLASPLSKEAIQLLK